MAVDAVGWWLAMGELMRIGLFCSGVVQMSKKVFVGMSGGVDSPWPRAALWLSRAMT